MLKNHEKPTAFLLAMFISPHVCGIQPLMESPSVEVFFSQKAPPIFQQRIWMARNIRDSGTPGRCEFTDGATAGFFNGNSRILKWRYCTICLAIFCGDIPIGQIVPLLRFEESKCIWKRGQCLGQVVILVHHSFFGGRKTMVKLFSPTTTHPAAQRQFFIFQGT